MVESLAFRNGCDSPFVAVKTSGDVVALTIVSLMWAPWRKVSPFETKAMSVRTGCAYAGTNETLSHNAIAPKADRT